MDRERKLKGMARLKIELFRKSLKIESHSKIYPATQQLPFCLTRYCGFLSLHNIMNANFIYCTLYCHSFYLKN